MKRQTVAFIVLILAVAALIAPVTARAAVITNISIPIAVSVLVPCANGGTGEVVTLTGDLHVLIHETVDSNGGFHLDLQSQPQGVSGIAAPSGNKYQGTGETSLHVNFPGPPPSESSLVNNFKIIGQGPGNNFMVHENFHVTVSANGDVTALHGNLTIDCK